MLISHTRFRTRSVRHQVRACGLGQAVLFSMALVISGQERGENVGKFEFEVASVKPAAMPDLSAARQSGSEIRVGTRIYGNRAEFIAMSLHQLIAEAYQVRMFQVTAAPGGFPKGRFDIVCKMPAGSRKVDAPMMLQALLADRFKLAVHRESREQDVLVLIVGKGGPKFKESSSEAAPNSDGAQNEGQASTVRPVTTTRSGNATISGMSGRTSLRTTLDNATFSVHYETHRMTMSYLADLISRGTTFANDRPVVDMTELKGEYDVVFDFPMSAVPGMITPTAAGSGPAETASTPGSGAVLRSIRSLGLDLQRRKATLERIVVDHSEKTPTEN